ncbi:MAG TPA: DUF2059 domain-containing protein [Edaphobacter sp.]|jgi:hypothetical protein|nr:DUF2059 domain-containing protein [Edaphobacter sp.]
MYPKKFTLQRVAILTGLFFSLFPFALAQDKPLAPPARPATLEQVEKLMKLTKAADRIKSLMHSNIEVQKNQKPQLFPSAFWDELEQELDKIDWIKIATPVYQRYFSVEEADSVIAFYSTPVGQKVLESSTVMTQELSAQGFKLGKEIGERLGEKYQKEIEKLRSEQTTEPSPK